MIVIRDREKGLLWFNQEGYVEKIIEKYYYEDLTLVKIPFNILVLLWLLPYEYEPLMDDRPEYLSKLGSMNYLSSGIRPDIIYTVSRLCEGNARPGKYHFAVIKHLFRYLKDIKGLIIIIGRHPGPGLYLHCYSDTSLADVLGTRHSTRGHIVFITNTLVH